MPDSKSPKDCLMFSDIDWSDTPAAVFRSKSERLKPVTHIDALPLECLIGIDSQKQQLLANTRSFLQSKPALHALLWGARGTGKSSLIKALLADLAPSGLRLVQIAKEDLDWLPEISDAIRASSFRFILYCDDLSFETDDTGYQGLKTILEGGIESPPDNLLLYATSNRRHLLPEYHHENQAEVGPEGEIHYGDSVEEKISLSDRFGLWIGFYQGSLPDYLAIVDSYFPDFTGSREKLHRAARLFAQARASHSGRTAKQFWQHHTQHPTY